MLANSLNWEGREGGREGKGVEKRMVNLHI
jgi:hypothetical protein